jgi:DNA polymerase-3 subunit epsilon
MDDLKRWLVFDTETTGLTLPSAAPLDQQPQIIEIAVMELIHNPTRNVTNGARVIVGCDWTYLFDPGKPLTEEINKITGLTDDDLKGKPSFAAALPELIKIFHGAHGLIAHNLPFDLQMLVNELRRCGKEYAFPYPPEQICTVQSFFHLKGRRMKLTELYQHFMGKELDQKHRAMSDVEALAEIVVASELLD